MKEAIITVGISASGKSTWATEFCSQSPGFYIIERDEIRQAIFKEKTGDDFIWRKWRWKWEDEVTNLQWELISECAITPQVKGIVISDTNLNQKRNDEMVLKLYKLGFNASFRYFDIDVNEAIKRDRLRGKNTVGSGVIRKQFSQFELLT